MRGVLLDLGNWLAQYADHMALAVIATLIFIYGADINRFVRKHVRRAHFFVRLGIFVLVCAFGFGAATILGVSLMRRALLHVDRPLLAPVVLLIFLAIGFLAERKNHM